MRLLLTIGLFFTAWIAGAQSRQNEVAQRVKLFHQAMVAGSGAAEYLDDSLTYGHSNGWVEDKKAFLADLGSLITYHAFGQDSLQISVSGDAAYARFVADVDATLNGKRMQFHLRVLEVWIKRGTVWKLFARQAIK
ncbi:MAG: nuclear transport factor 2 family protein [Chitinophagaceae bacterium]